MDGKQLALFIFFTVIMTITIPYIFDYPYNRKAKFIKNIHYFNAKP